MNREPWHAAVHGVAKNWTWLSDWTGLNWGSLDHSKNEVLRTSGIIWVCFLRAQAVHVHILLTRLATGGFRISNPMARGALEVISFHLIMSKWGKRLRDTFEITRLCWTHILLNWCSSRLPLHLWSLGSLFRHLKLWSSAAHVWLRSFNMQTYGLCPARIPDHVRLLWPHGL